MGEVILVASGKGGTGKTVITANMGAVLAQRGYKVVLIDMDLGFRNLDLCLGLESKVVYDVCDVLTGLCRIKQALIRDKRFNHLYLMAAAPKKEDADLTPLHMKVLCKKLKKRFDYILIDAPSGIGEGLGLAAAGADRAWIITVPEYTALRDADILDRYLIQAGITDRMVVLNKVKTELITTGFIPGIKEIARRLRPELAGVIQYDDNIHIAANNGLPIVYKTGTYIEENFNKIADRLLL